ncbi:hypothetical protein RRF57_001490 [Xylaria bambusicola]|uniref:Uncharacterized protein n=1 Tax=Xylaria bambusicola TaxID=326684 RepID=A0AAN7YUY7_9PEZI
MPNKPRHNEFHLSIRKIKPDAIPRAVRERFRHLPSIISEARVLARPALRDERFGFRPVERAISDGVDGDTNRSAPG